MPASVLSVRVDADVKESFSSLCDELGLTTSAAVNLFMRQALREGGIPFKITTGHATIEYDSTQVARVLTLPEIKAAVTEAARKTPAIAKAILFGSYARGEATPESDIDLRIEVDDSQAFGMVAFGSFADAVESKTEKSVDVVSARELKEGFAQEIEREGVVVYEREEVGLPSCARNIGGDPRKSRQDLCLSAR